MATNKIADDKINKLIHDIEEKNGITINFDEVDKDIVNATSNAATLDRQVTTLKEQKTQKDQDEKQRQALSLLNREIRENAQQIALKAKEASIALMLFKEAVAESIRALKDQDEQWDEADEAHKELLEQIDERYKKLDEISKETAELYQTANEESPDTRLENEVQNEPEHQSQEQQYHNALEALKTRGFTVTQLSANEVNVAKESAGVNFNHNHQTNEVTINQLTDHPDSINETSDALFSMLSPKFQPNSTNQITLRNNGNINQMLMQNLMQNIEQRANSIGHTISFLLSELDPQNTNEASSTTPTPFKMTPTPNPFFGQYVKSLEDDNKNTAAPTA